MQTIVLLRYYCRAFLVGVDRRTCGIFWLASSRHKKSERHSWDCVFCDIQLRFLETIQISDFWVEPSLDLLPKVSGYIVMNIVWLSWAEVGWFSQYNWRNRFWSISGLLFRVHFALLCVLPFWKSAFVGVVMPKFPFAPNIVRTTLLSSFSPTFCCEASKLTIITGKIDECLALSSLLCAHLFQVSTTAKIVP